jgi:outer membrane protein TolC
MLVMLLGSVAACGAPVDGERLTGLTETGLSAELLEATDERLDRALSRGDDAELRAAAFGSLQTGSGPMTPTALTEAALARNTRIGAAAEAIALADAERLNAIFGYLPQVSVRYNLDQYDQRVLASDNEVFALGTAQYPVTVASVRATQPIFDLARIFAINHARNARTQAEVEYLATLRSVVYEVLDAYVVAGQAQQRAQALRQRAAMMDRQISAQGALAETGLGTMMEPAGLRSERASIASEESLELSRYAEALGALAALTGTAVRDVAPLTMLAGVMGSERNMDVDALVARGLRENPTIMASALSVVGADVLRRQALSADFSPVLEAYAQLERRDRADSRFGGASLTEDQTVGVQFTVPLFNARGQGYEMATSNVRLRRAALDYNATRRQLETDIVATHARMVALAQAAGQASSAAQQAATAQRAEQDRVDMGESSDFAVAARDLRRSVAAERAAFYNSEYLRAWLRLQYLTGVDLRGGL